MSISKTAYVSWIPSLELVPGDIIVTAFTRHDESRPLKTEEVKTVERRRGCDGVHVNTDKCYSRCASVPVLRHSAKLADFINILEATTVSFDYAD